MSAVGSSDGGGGGDAGGGGGGAPMCTTEVGMSSSSSSSASSPVSTSVSDVLASFASSAFAAVSVCAVADSLLHQR